MSQENNHPSHPIRNFFYVLWSLINIFAFVGLFVAISLPVLPYRLIYIFAAATLLVLALVFGVFRPLFGSKHR